MPKGSGCWGRGQPLLCGSVPAAASPRPGLWVPRVGQGHWGASACRTCPFLLEGHRLTEPCVTAGRGGPVIPPLSDGTRQPPAAGCSHVLHPPANIPRQFKQGRCVGDVWQGVGPGWVPSLGQGHGRCRRVVPTAEPLASGMLQPRPGEPPLGLIPASPQFSRSWASGHPCLVPGCKVISVFALVIIANCRGFIDQLGEVLPVFLHRKVECKQSGDLGCFPAKQGGDGGESAI